MGSCRCRSVISVSLMMVMMIVFGIISVSGQRNITVGSSIVATAANATSTWTTSPSGEFAIGFKQLTPDGSFLLAIWFDRIPQKTIVWSANRDNPVPARSTANLSANGALELIDPSGRRIWRAGESGTVAYAAMLDTGNFVIAGRNSTIFLWQSFNSPTDTLLPGQTLNRGGLVSSFSESNYSRGRFRMNMQADGNLVLYTRRFPFNDVNSPYWISETKVTGTRLIFNQSGDIGIFTQNETLLRPLFNSGALAGGGNFRQRLTLEYDGVLRHYVYDYGHAKSSSAVRDFIPSNICLDIKEEEQGSGACGFNSICSLGIEGRPSCTCPTGYSSSSDSGGLTGCLPDFLQHRCDQQSQDAQNFRLRDLYNTDWPSADYSGFLNVDEDWCRQSCLADCYCAAAIYYMRGCYKKSLPFPNGRVDSGFDGKAFIKVRMNTTTTSIDFPNSTTSGTTSSSSSSSSSKSSSTTLIIALSISLGCSLLSSALLFVFYLRGRKLIMDVRASGVHPAGVNTITRFCFKELREATNGFEDELGRGACSTVYKGILRDTAGSTVVAVKKLNRIAEESDPEFQAEVSSISRTNHKNLVRLLGYCDEGQHRILVYEFMKNGSLANLLFENSSKPNWYSRVQIAFAIARGLCYLHEECSSQIIHCDIKPQNVLLDENYTPRIADFGLAKLMRPDQTKTTTGIRGTRGYVAPEWFRNMPITVKVDVYSFGIMLLELLCCRRNYVPDVDEEVVLSDWAYDCYQQGELDSLVAGDEEAKSDIKMLERFVQTAIWCIQEDPAMRPHMKRVMHMLEGSIQVPAPPDPTTFMIT